MTLLNASILLFIVALSNAVNAIMDSVDHNSGASPLRDFWHSLKYLDRLLLISVGAQCILSGFSFLALALLLIPAVVFGKLIIWDYLYYNHVDLWLRLDRTIKISTGWPWLDKLLGFHH